MIPAGATEVIQMYKLIIATAISIAVASSAFGDDFSESHAAIGKTNGVLYSLGALVPSPVPSVSPTPTVGSAESVSGDTAGLYAAISAMIFGKDQSILQADAGMTNLLEGESNFYWGGFKVWSTKPVWKDGAFQVAAGLPTVSMRAPIVRLPVGPVTLAVDAGISAEASITAKIAPMISIPIQFTSVRGTLETDTAASGFIEGYATWLIVRAGIGGELELVRGDASVSGQVSFGAFPPAFNFSGYLNLLAGKIYGFVDYFNLWGWKWKRALKPVFANWPGKCIPLTAAVGGANPCAISTP
jgi:hypothetical protein